MKYIYLLLLIVTVQLASATNHAFIRNVPDTLRFHNASPYSYTLDVDVNNDGVNDITLLIQELGGSGSALTITAQSDNNTSGWLIEVDQPYPGAQQALPYNCGAYVNTGGGFTGSGDMTLFKGNGARYISVRKQLVNGYYNYGWIKLDVSPSGGTMIVYATGYSDYLGQPNETQMQVGLGECTYPDAITETTPLSALQMYTSANQLYVNGTPRADLNIFDITGKQVATFNYTGQQTTFNLQHLAAGSYLVEATNGETRMVMKMIIE